jgi:hypothetical protein
MRLLLIWLLLVSPVWADQLDVVILSNGGASAEMGYSDETRFRADAQRVQDYHLAREPYKSRVADIAWHVLWNTTPLGCKRSSSTSRLITCNESLAREQVLAAGLPMERGILLVNTTGYGGSGGYRFAVAYNGCSTCSDPVKVALHEFGHTLGNLADEYNFSWANGTNADAWYGQCWKGLTAPSAPGSWVKGCYRPNYWRQKAVKPDGSLSDSVMKSLGYTQFNQKSLELLNARLDYWKNQP